MKKSNFINKGETIVEVMIAIIVLGSALGGAFAVSNRSVSQTQSNHERFQAQLLANEQAELIRLDYAEAIAKGVSRNDYDPTSADVSKKGTKTFCTSQCPQPDGLYDITITFSSAAGAVSGVAKTYVIKVEWDSLTSGGKDNVELLYGL